MTMKNFVCMKWGTLYDAGYVNKLYAMVKRNVSGEFRFVCLTDDSHGVNPAVECLDCPSVSLPPPWNNTGWRKVALWSEQLPGMQGDWLFLDLDVVITGSLDAFFEYQPDKSFVVMQNWTQPGQGIGNTSVYRFTVGRHPYLLSGMLEDFMSVVKRYRNEQTFVSRVISEIAFWPDEWCILFKIQCVPPMPARWWKAPVLPTGARIVAFPGLPNPGDAAAGIWPEKKFYKRLYKHIRPAAWIANHWRE
jgi:hypothetical protein